MAKKCAVCGRTSSEGWLKVGGKDVCCGKCASRVKKPNVCEFC